MTRTLPDEMQNKSCSFISDSTTVRVKHGRGSHGRPAAALTDVHVFDTG